MHIRIYLLGNLNMLDPSDNGFKTITCIYPIYSHLMRHNILCGLTLLMIHVLYLTLYGYKVLNHLSLQYISNLFASYESRFPKRLRLLNRRQQGLYERCAVVDSGMVITVFNF